MVVPVNMAISAYNNVAKSLTGGGDSAAGASLNGGPSFMDFVKEAAHSAIDTQKKSEDISAKGLVGKATPNEVVQAMTDAEMTLSEVKGIRDAVIDAYKSVLTTSM